EPGFYTSGKVALKSLLYPGLSTTNIRRDHPPSFTSRTTSSRTPKDKEQHLSYEGSWLLLNAAQVEAEPSRASFKDAQAWTGEISLCFLRRTSRGRCCILLYYFVQVFFIEKQRRQPQLGKEKNTNKSLIMYFTKYSSVAKYARSINLQLHFSFRM
ncbi:hypothetical protein SKAU_G00263580, partial [Synaphobranchus kaupii]